MTLETTNSGREAPARTADPWTTIARTQRHLVARIDALRDCPAEGRARLLDELGHDLAAHTATEENELYSVLLSIPEAREPTRHSMVEHRDLLAAVQELRELGVTSPRWRDKLAVLRMRLRRHHDRELRELRPVATRSLDAEQLGLIGARLQIHEEAPTSAAA